MRLERTRRRPRFRPGIELRLADGQVWTLPLPPEPIGEAVPSPGDREVTWDDQGYREILRAALDAQDEGELFRAEMALAIHLLDWNYSLDPDDFEELLDDRGDDRRRADLSATMRTLALAHIGPIVFLAGNGRHPAPYSRWHEGRLLIGQTGSRIVGRLGPQGAGGSVDLTASDLDLPST
jgi:hypothetical protein